MVFNAMVQDEIGFKVSCKRAASSTSCICFFPPEKKRGVVQGTEGSLAGQDFINAIFFNYIMSSFF